MLNKFTEVCRVVSFYIRHPILLLLILESSHHSTRYASSSRTETTTQIWAAESWVASWNSRRNSKEQNPYWACDNNFGGQDVLSFTVPAVQHCVQKNIIRPYPEPHVAYLVLNLTSYFIKAHIHIILPSTPRYSKLQRQKLAGTGCVLSRVLE